MARIPVLIVNLKTYEQGTGKQALRFAKIAETIAKKLDVHIMLAVQPTDIRLLASHVNLPILAQHIDPIRYGAYTGFLLPEAVKAAGAYGTLINHSEHRLRIDQLAHTVKRAKEVGLFTVVCANDIDQGKAVGEFMPDLVALEPPELIGGNVSVSNAKPELITHAVKTLNKIIVRDTIKQLNRVIVGAGIKTRKDVEQSLVLGAVGVLVASGAVKANDPEKALTELALGLKKK